jgi:predicted phage terminase large subunit-like protein
MGKVKAFETILTGWGDPICRRHGKRARKICASSEYQELFGTSLDPNTRAAEDWQLTNNSSYKSSGINSGVAGFRTHGLVWDDLTKNRKEADSETIRNDVYNAYIDDARSRKTPTAWEVGIGTRWHEDEIMGRILPEGYNGESGFMECRDGNVWYVICMAAECERTAQQDPLGRNKGEMIWPEWFDPGYWKEKRMVPRSWGSLYQQRPAPESGIIFQRDKFKYYDVLPEGDNWISYDPGVSEYGDPTAMHVWRVDDMARLYLIESYYDQVSIDVWIVQLIMWIRIWKPIEAVSESGVIRRAAEPFIKRAMMKAKAFFSQSWVTRSANKQAMAAGAVAMVNSGQVFLPHNSDGERFIEACLKFPASKDDHEVDSFVNLCLRLENIWEAHPPKTHKDEAVVISDGSIKISSLMPPRFSKRKKSVWAHTK